MNTEKLMHQWKKEHLPARDAILRWAQGLEKDLTPLLPRSNGWSYFGTMTFRRGIPSYHALSASARLLTWCSRWRVAAPRTAKPLFRLLLWSAEGHASGNVHLHALSACIHSMSPAHCGRCTGSSSPHDPPWRILKESWYTHHGIARVRPYDAQLGGGAEGYVLKYVLKETCLDWGVATW